MVQHMLSVFINNYSLAGNDNQDYMHAACRAVKEYMAEWIRLQALFLFHIHVLKKKKLFLLPFHRMVVGPQNATKNIQNKLK